MHKSFPFGVALGNISIKCAVIQLGKIIQFNRDEGDAGDNGKTNAYLVIKRTKTDYLILRFLSCSSLLSL